MFIEITWKNKKGDTLRSFVESDKVQGFVDSFVSRDVEPTLNMPDEVTPEALIAVNN